MGTLIVVNLDELIKAFLLLQKIERSWLGGLFLEGQVHALMASVLFGMARLDTLDVDA